MYAILSHGGRQYRVSAGDRLLVDRLEAEVGSVIALEPVLLTGGEGTTAVGEGVEGMRVAAIVVGHRRGPKLRIFKYKPKKRYRRAAGYRSDLTEVRIDSILGKGEALPAAASAPAKKPVRRAAAAKAPAEAEATPAAKAPAARASAKPARAKPAPSKTSTPAAGAKRSPRRKPAAAPADSEESGDGA